MQYTVSNSRTSMFLLILLGSSGICLAQTLILNPSFETVPSAWEGGILYFSGTPNTVSGTGVGAILDGSSSGNAGPVSQLIPTQLGVQYEIRFNLRLPELDGFGVPILGDSRGGSTSINVLWGTQLLGQIAVTERDTWTQYQFYSTADSTTVRLGFENLSRDAYPLIDDVSMVAVPEIDGSTIAAAGLLALAAGRRILSSRERICRTGV